MMSSKLKTSIRKRNKTDTKHLQCMVEGLLRYGNIDPTGKSPKEIEQQINSYMEMPRQVRLLILRFMSGTFPLDYSKRTSFCSQRRLRDALRILCRVVRALAKSYDLHVGTQKKFERQRNTRDTAAREV